MPERKRYFSSMSSLNESICSPSFILTPMPLIYETAPDVLRRLTDQRRRTDEWEVSRWSGWAESEATTLSLLIRWSGLVTPCYTLSYLVTPCHTSLHLFTPFQSCYTLSKHLSHPWTVNCAMMTEPTHKLADQNKTSVSQIQKQLKMSLNSHFWFAWPKKINSC